MSLPTTARRLTAMASVVLIVSLAQGCGSGGGSTTATGGAIALALTTSSGSVTVGGSLAVSATLTRSGGFTGDVAIVVTGAPSGVTGAATNLSTVGTTTTATVNLIVAGSATPGTYQLTVQATGTGVSAATASFTLTITGGGTSDYTLSVLPSTFSVVQGANTTAAVTLTRTSFSGSVNLSITGAPTGVTAAFSPNNTTGSTSTMTLSVGASVAAGQYTVYVGGVAAGVADKVTPMTLTVTASGGGGSGNVTLDWSACAVGYKPNWVAYQDGTGPWTRVTSLNAVYQFTVASAKAGFAYQYGGTQVIVTYQTSAELTGATQNFCPNPSNNTNSMGGTVAGLAAGQQATLSMAGAITSIIAPTTALGLNGMPAVTADLVGYRSAIAGPSATDKVLLMRDIPVVNLGSVGTVDFGSAAAATVASGTITIGNDAGNSLAVLMSYGTGASCYLGTLYQVTNAATSFAGFGVPAAIQRSTDAHLLSITGIGTNNNRVVQEAFHAMGPRTMTLPAVVSAPTVTDLGGNYKRLQAVYTIPSDYTSGSGLMYIEFATSKVFSIYATAAWMGGSAGSLAAPNFTGVAGWSDSWAPATGATVNWTLSTNGTTLPTSICSDGFRVVQSQLSGTN